ncbi:MAG TPA: 16S rRNA (cytidine(1402)-2'-O)-methyltransferase [Ilumatobacteraceae bacterium]|nr:16S rRNA (cytidine(1402)-2'-O)-methyltransferase [Ilumatobacteraceae bacterium]HUC32927.1 16S rRNA (cytidine(1402)-2'-O)-methyltransferase [Ilumatobacteraceae bacterium]
MTGRLVLVSTPIGNLGDLPPRAVETLRGCALICCEDTRHSGKLLSHAGVSGVRLAIANEHTEMDRVDEVLGLLAGGADVAVVTDAGTPGVSDPGARLVRAAIDAGYAISAVPGPAAFVVGLVLSGFDTGRFVFEGFLPRSGRERTERLEEIAIEQRTVVLYEAPHRVRRTVADLTASCGGDRRVALARELTKRFEEVWRGTLADAQRHVGEQEPRGEYVVVVDGASPPGPADDDAILTALRMALQGGADRRTAVATVMAATGAAKRRVYDLALTLPR